MRARAHPQREGLLFSPSCTEVGALVVQRRLARRLHRVHARKRRRVLEQLVQDHAERVHIHLRSPAEVKIAGFGLGSPLVMTASFLPRSPSRRWWC